jgi:hypothetical protein
MKRIAISLFSGIAVTLAAPTLAALALYRGNTDAIVPTVLYWPVFVTDKLGLGLDCANADLISDKLTCMRMALLIDAISYPLIILVCSYILHRIVFRRGRRLRHSPVV